jgi:hypothetical protein
MMVLIAGFARQSQSPCSAHSGVLAAPTTISFRFAPLAPRRYPAAVSCSHALTVVAKSL